MDDDVPNKKYSTDTINQVQYLYILGILTWIILIIILDLYHTDIIGCALLLIPVVYLLISMFSFGECSPELEEELFQYDILAFGVVMVSIFIAIKYPDYSSFFYKLIFVGILLIGLSMLDLWIPKRDLTVYKHIKTILEVYAVTIFIFIFYAFYFLASKTDSKDKNPFTDLGFIKNLHRDCK